MRVAVLSTVTWRTPPRQYGPWEQVASTIAEGLVERGMDVTLFATGDSTTTAKLQSISKTAWGEDSSLDPKVWECLHISHLMQQADEFDIIHNHYDFLPLTYSLLIDTPMITTIHGFSSPQILPVYKKYNESNAYISISEADRHHELDYLQTIYHGINPEDFYFNEQKDNYLLYFGRIHPDKGAHLAIEIAKASGLPLKIAGLVQDKNYFTTQIESHLEKGRVDYVGNADPTQRNQLLGGARALLHPICFEEPFGLSVVEAMMCGTPVIAFSRGSMPELIINGMNGFLVSDVEEATIAVNQVASIKPKACRDYAVSHFSQDRMIDEYVAAYKKVLFL